MLQYMVVVRWLWEMLIVSPFLRIFADFLRLRNIKILKIIYVF